MDIKSATIERMLSIRKKLEEKIETRSQIINGVDVYSDLSSTGFVFGLTYNQACLTYYSSNKELSLEFDDMTAWLGFTVSEWLDNIERELGL